MGRVREDDKNRATDACRVPPGLSHRTWLAKAVIKLKQPEGPLDTSRIDLSIFVTFWIILLLFVPLWNIPYSLGATIQITQGEEVDWNNGFEIDAIPYVGLNETILLNSTPDDNSIWDTGAYYADTKTTSDDDGYTISVSGAITNPGFFSCVTRTSISIPDIEELYFIAILNGIAGSCNVSLSVSFTVWDYPRYEITWVNFFERSITGRLNQGEKLNLTLSTPLALLKTISPSWLSNVAMSIMIRGTPSATVTIEESVIKTISDKPLYPVTIDVTASTGESFHSSHLTRYLNNPPVIVLNKTGEYGSPAIPLGRANYTVFLPQGQYSSTAGWFKYGDESNPVIDAQIVPFEIVPERMIHLLLKMRAFRFDITCNAPIPLRSIEVPWSGEHSDLLTTPFSYRRWPDHFYIPPVEGSIGVYVRFGEWYLQTYTELSTGHNYKLTFNSPLTMNIYGLLLNLGQILDFGLLLLMIFLVMKRLFVKAAHINRRSLISDNRFIPLVLLLCSFLFPWVQYSEWGDYRTSYFPALSVRVLTLQNNITFTVISFGEWVFLGLLSIVLLWAPLVGLIHTLPFPDSKAISKKTAKLLFLPFLYGALYLIGILLSGFTLSLGAILAMLGLPIWLVQKVYRRETGLSDVHPLSKKSECDT